MRIAPNLLLGTLLAAVPGHSTRLYGAENWPLWSSYAQRFMDPHGRVIDPDSQDRTTSEAQAYAMFFALVANDRPRFEQLLEWTQNNLAHGDLSKHLPAWHWGVSKSGRWEVQDENSASDADLWIAFSLLEAGQRWNRPALSDLGLGLTQRIASLEVTDIPKLGPMLLPGMHGFQTPDGYVLNPSYLPAQVLLGLAARHPSGPWRKIAERVPELVKASSPHGFVFDWIGYDSRKGFDRKSVRGAEPVSSYDAIRVYLWAGMLAPETPGRKEILSALDGMSKYLDRHPRPPAEVRGDGHVINANGDVSVSAAIIPYLNALGKHRNLTEQWRRLAAEWNPAAGLYGSPARYYDQNMALFSTGWSEGRFSFTKDGELNLKWR